MAITEAQLRELTRRHHLRVLGIRGQFVGQILRLWDTLQPIGDAQADQFTNRAVIALLGAQTTVSNLTSGYLATALGMMGPSKPIVGADLRNGVSPFDVYLRGIITTRKQLSEGKPPVEALAIGRARTEATAALDAMLPQRAQMDAWAKAGKIQGYRRVLTGSSCPLCAVASTQRYHGAHLMPIHNRCDCGVAVIVGDMDPGRIINRPLYKELKKSGVIDDITKARQNTAKSLPAQRAKALADKEAALKRRGDLRAELATEQDSARRRRLEERLGRANDDLASAERRIETLKDPPIDRPAPNWAAHNKLLSELGLEGPASDVIAIHAHGELGPVLTSAGDHFTGPSGI